MIAKSTLAGLFISIASYIYLQIEGTTGAFLFSIGLLVILNMRLKLFTGTVGFIKSKQDIKVNAAILLGNIVGSCGALCFPHPSSLPLITTKLATPLPEVFLKGVICGMFIYSAVSCFKREKDYMVPVCIAGFILFGAEHCIADLAYVIMARTFSLKILLFLTVVTIGNSVGAILFNRIDNK